IDNNKGMLRYLRDDYVDASSSREWYEQEFIQIENDYKSLQRILREIDIYSKKLSMCYRVCSPSMQVDNEDKLRRLQRVKLALLSKRPILASKNIENIILSDKKSEKDFRKALVETYSSYLGSAQDKISELQQRFGNEERSYNFAKDSREEVREKRLLEFFKSLEGEIALDNMSSSILSELDWEQELENSEDSELACHFYKKNKDYIYKENLKDIGTEIGLVAAPFLAGPAFRLGVWGLKGTRLLKWGMREELYASVVKATAGASSTSLFVKDSLNLSNKRKECSNKLNQFMGTSNAVHYQKFIECNQDYNTDLLILAAETSLTGFSSFKGIMDGLKISKGFDSNNSLYHVKDYDELTYYLSKKEMDNATYGEAGFKFSSEKGDYYVLNLNGPKDEVSQISSKYWSFVSDTYRKRLNLSDQEVKDFIKSSEEMEYRTTLFVSTEKDKADSMRGGLAFVNSTDAEELLPFEKATGVRVKREKGKKTGEIVRFTVDEKLGDRKLSDELLSQLLSSFKSQDKIDSVYVYTSKSHKRLYERLLKKMKIPYNLTHDLDRDVVMEIEVK
ncbi:hypothetical protein, partial [Halobacteriovorax sp.]|uniref:hypothetical protein n=1 Tax=Halobacteriovorax sp. TaxID=2020862 RepID=UPI003563BCC2